MTARSSTALSGPLRGLVGGLRAAVRSALLPALAASTASALLLAAGPVLTAARASDGSSTEPAFAAGPLLALIAVLPAAAAWLFAGSGRLAAAAGLLGALAVLAVGRAVADSQLLFDPWSAARPDLLVPTSLAELESGPAVPVLLLGHALAVLAGVLALAAMRRVRPVTAPPAASAGSSGLTAALCAGTVAAAGLVSLPFRSTDPYLAPNAAMDAPLPTLVGVLLIAAGAVLAACLAASAADLDTARGGLVGTALGVAVVALQPLMAAATSDAVGASTGPFLALGGAALLAGTAWLVGRLAAAGAGDDELDAEADAASDTEVRLPAVQPMHRIAGGLAVAAGLAGLLGAVSRHVVVGELLEQPVMYPARLLVPAGLLLTVLGVLLLAPARVAAPARPALSVAWAGMALAATATLDLALTATQLAGVRAGFGVWPTALALMLAPAAGAVAALAGSVERDDVDLTERRADRPVLVAGGLAAALAVPGFGLPLVTAAGYVPAGLWSRFGVASWGLVAGATVVVAAGLLAPWSRPARAVGLLLGAAAVVAVHLSALPLIGGRGEEQASVAAGTWFASASGLALLVAAVVAGQRQHRQGHGARQGAAKATKYSPGRSTSGRKDTRPVARRSSERSNPRGRRQART
jgi:hypothetical protein